MTVTIHLYYSSQPVKHEAVLNAYLKGDLYCVMLQDMKVYKYPLVHIFRICEE